MTSIGLIAVEAAGRGDGETGVEAGFEGNVRRLALTEAREVGTDILRPVDS